MRTFIGLGYITLENVFIILLSRFWNISYLPTHLFMNSRYPLKRKMWKEWISFHFHFLIGRKMKAPEYLTRACGVRKIRFTLWEEIKSNITSKVTSQLSNFLKDEIIEKVRKWERIKTNPDHRHLLRRKIPNVKEKNAYLSDFGSARERRKYRPGQRILLWDH